MLWTNIRVLKGGSEALELLVEPLAFYCLVELCVQGMAVISDPQACILNRLF